MTNFRHTVYTYITYRMSHFSIIREKIRKSWKEIKRIFFSLPADKWFVVIFGFWRMWRHTATWRGLSLLDTFLPFQPPRFRSTDFSDSEESSVFLNRPMCTSSRIKITNRIPEAGSRRWLAIPKGAFFARPQFEEWISFPYFGYVVKSS